MTIHHDFELNSILWYKIGGKARYLLECGNKDDVMQALDFITNNNVQKVFVCGVGANLLFTDEYFDGAVIHIISDVPDVRVEGNKLTAFAGTIFGKAIEYGFEHGLVGLEWAGGLPGTVGAAVRGNVGAYGGEVKDSIESAEIVQMANGKWQIVILSNEELEFAYRESIVKKQKNMMVLSATFALKKATTEELAVAEAEYNAHIAHRRERHPLEYPNCGSVFKNIKKPEEVAKVLAVFPELEEQVKTKWFGKVAAAALIQRLGLQGYRVGDAQISEKHALFIVNLGNAKAKDVLAVINHVQETFQQTFGFALEPEVEIVQ